MQSLIHSYVSHIVEFFCVRQSTCSRARTRCVRSFGPLEKKRTLSGVRIRILRLCRMHSQVLSWRAGACECDPWYLKTEAYRGVSLFHCVVVLAKVVRECFEKENRKMGFSRNKKKTHNPNSMSKMTHLACLIRVTLHAVVSSWAHLEDV